MRHPLAGADPATLIAALRQGGAPDRIGAEILARVTPILPDPS